MTDLFDLSNKTALITGSSSGMGKAIAHALGLHNARIVLSSFEPLALQKTVDEFLSQGINASGIPCDLRFTSDIERLISKTERTVGVGN